MSKEIYMSLKKKKKNGSQVHEKMFYIINPQRNASQIQIRYHLTPIRMIIIIFKNKYWW